MHHVLLLWEESRKEMSETSNSGGLCARFSPDCGSVFAEVNTLEQFSSKRAEPGCVQTRDTRCYCFASHIMSTQAAPNTCERSKIVLCSASLRRDSFTLPAHTQSVLLLNTHSHPFWIRVKACMIRQSQTSSALFPNAKRINWNVLYRNGAFIFHFPLLGKAAASTSLPRHSHELISHLEHDSCASFKVNEQISTLGYLPDTPVFFLFQFRPCTF